MSNTGSASKKEVAQRYNICASTFRSWIKKAKLDIPKDSRILNPAQLKLIGDTFGRPDNWPWC